MHVCTLYIKKWDLILSPRTDFTLLPLRMHILHIQTIPKSQTTKVISCCIVNLLGLCPTSFSFQSLVCWENPFSKQMERQNMPVKSSGWKQMALFLIFYVLLPKKGTRPSHSPFMNGRKLEIFVELFYLLSHISISYRCICFWKELCKFIIAICIITDWRETLFDYHMILDWAEK